MKPLSDTPFLALTAQGTHRGAVGSFKSSIAYANRSTHRDCHRLGGRPHVRCMEHEPGPVHLHGGRATQEPSCADRAAR